MCCKYTKNDFGCFEHKENSFREAWWWCRLQFILGLWSCDTVQTQVLVTHQGARADPLHLDFWWWPTRVCQQNVSIIAYVEPWRLLFYECLVTLLLPQPCCARTGLWTLETYCCNTTGSFPNQVKRFKRTQLVIRNSALWRGFTQPNLFLSYIYIDCIHV